MTRQHTPFNLRNATAAFAGVILLALLAQTAHAQSGEQIDEGRRLYREMCAACHNIGGGDKVGPDLKDVAARRTPAWLREMIRDPQGFTQSDAVAKEVAAQYAGVMVLGRTLSDSEIAALLAFLEAESQLEKSEFAAIERIARAITAADISAGRDLFFGMQTFEKGAPSCVSCHHVDGEGSLGGGRLAANLTAAYARYTTQNPDGLYLAISNPGFPVMQDVFRDHPLTSDEAFKLNAYLKDVSAKSPAQESGEIFLILGLVGSAFALAIFDFIWRKRFTAVRKQLVGGRS